MRKLLSIFTILLLFGCGGNPALASNDEDGSQGNSSGHADGCAGGGHQ